MRSLTLVCCLILSSLAAATEQWPQYRGPAGNGHAEGSRPPVTWSETENIRWRTAIHGKGWCSPVIWNDQVWLTTATEDGKDMFALCVDKKSGEIVRDIRLFQNEKPRFCHATNSYASPTPVIEEGRIYIHFGSYGTACLDTKTGETLWSRRDLLCDHWRGPGSSPILFAGMLIVHFDGYDYQYVVALNKETGETVWKTDRDIDYGTDDGDFMKAYSTPIVVDVDGRPQLISPAAKATIAYDPFSGKELWKVRYEQHSAATRPIFGHGLFYINTGFPKAQLWAVRTGGEGDITDTHVQWTMTRSVPSMPSQLLIGDLLYMIHDGVATCMDAKTGNVVWTERVSGKYLASPVHVAGKIYFFDRDGKTTVIAAGREYVQLAENHLEKGFMSSPAVSGDALFLRTTTHLYRIEE